MKNFTLPITIEAYTEEEAKAKLELLLSFGSFLLDLDIEELTGKFAHAVLLGFVGKLTNEFAQSATKKEVA